MSRFFYLGAMLLISQFEVAVLILMCIAMIAKAFIHEYLHKKNNHTYTLLDYNKTTPYYNVPLYKTSVRKLQATEIYM
jgi:hypothetical protein